MRYPRASMKKKTKGATAVTYERGALGRFLKPPVTRERLLRHVDPDPEDAKDFVRFIYESRRSAKSSRELG